MLAKTCIVCNEKFKKKINCSLKDWEKSKYCSTKCRIFNTTFKKGQRAWNKGMKRYWKSNSFRKGFKWSEEVRQKMKGRIPWNKNLKGIHLSINSEFKKGSIPWHKGKGLTSFDRLFRLHKIYKEWRINVLKRDNFTCVLCGYKSHTTIKGRSDIVVDHIKPYALFPDLRTELSNGRTLCVPCHKNTETYGLNKQYFNATGA